ncbi:MAG TPA: hypothetical protein VKZ99_07205 [Gammaproteobacteria bacterium]|nr:hypothetical protein [Gammaproteobacteria bacterium]
MQSRIRTSFLILLLAFGAAEARELERWRLGAADWSRPRSAAAILELAPVAEAVRAWETERRRQPVKLVLGHPGGEAGALWAGELRDWLVALGLPPEEVQLAPGGQPEDRLEIRLETR